MDNNNGANDNGWVVSTKYPYRNGFNNLRVLDKILEPQLIKVF